MSQATTWGVPRNSTDSGLPWSPEDQAIRMDESLDAILSAHAGATRPSYAVKGTLWLDISVSPHIVKIFDGTQDATLGTVNPSTGLFTPSGIGTLTAGLASSQTFSGANIFSGSNQFNQPQSIGTIDVGSLGAAAAYTVPGLSAYRSILISGYALTTSIASGIGLRLSVDNGVNVVFSAGAYSYGVVGVAAVDSATGIPLTETATAARGFIAQIDFFNSAEPTTVRCATDLPSANSAQIRFGRRNLQEAHNALQLYAGGGLITAGAFYIRGWK